MLRFTNVLLICVAVFWLLAPRLSWAGKVTYIYTDPQGTPLAEADASGNITATFDYRHLWRSGAR